MASKRKAQLQEKMIRNQWAGIRLHFYGRKKKETAISMGSYFSDKTATNKAKEIEHDYRR